MSSAEEETKTASPQSTEEEHWCVLKKVSDLPLVSSTYEMVSASYTSAKESHPAIQAVCDMAEVGVKAIATTAASGAQPLLDKLEPQIAVVDNIACKSLDKLQETLPVVQQAVEKVVSGAKGLLTESLAPVYTRVTEAKDAMSSVVDLARETAHEHMEMAKSAVRSGVNTMMETSVGQMMAEGVDRMIDKSDELIDDYLPMTDDELAALAASVALEDPDVAPLEKQKEEQSYYVRLGSLSAKLRTRAYHHSLMKVRIVKQAAQEALFQLGQVIELIKYTKRSVDQKVQDKLQRMWQEWIKGQPSQTSEANQVEMESRALKISHNIAQKMQANCLKLLADMQGLPDALKEKVQQAHNNMEELQAALSKASSFEDVPSGFLKESQEKIDKAQAAVQEVMEYVTKNAPLTWVVGPFSPAGASSGESAEREENTKAAA
uniref:Perilipin n=1 Tax=Pogona vitticeps TaxID=103695 RepID=A0ABM5FRJ8_9SAUR